MAITPERLAASGSEHGHQAALFCWAAQSGIPELKWLFAVPNGFFSDPGQKAKMKAEGLRDGVPDVWLPLPIQTSWGHSFPGLVIEMKTEKRRNAKNGGLEPEQVEWKDCLIGLGYQHHICYNWEEARDKLLAYINSYKV